MHRLTSSWRGALLMALLLPVSPARAEVHAGDAAVDFDQRTLAGGKLKLSSLRGKVVLVDFWASWCEPCKKELPILARLAARLKPRGIEIVSVNIDDDPANAQTFLREHGVQITVVRDRDKAIVNQYEPPTMPSSYVIDRAGVVRVVNRGYEPGDEVKFERQLLALVDGR